jgi:endonuclease/exonuclease/phosphatase family metal-dependent hydrolase
MLSFLFWNIHKNPSIASFVGRIAARHDVDLFLFAECPKKPKDCGPLIDAMNAAQKGTYRFADVLPQRVRVASRLAPERLALRFHGQEVSVWEVRGKKAARFLLATVHLPAKTAGFDAPAQAFVARTVAAEVAEAEDDLNCPDTVLVGDFNMNPYEPGMVMPETVHGFMTMSHAEKPDRDYRGATYRRFYNPMWKLFGDRVSTAGGTFHWDAYAPNQHFWHMYDRVLVRPSLMRRLREVRILTSDGSASLLDANGAPDRDLASDHLPIFFRLAV